MDDAQRLLVSLQFAALAGPDQIACLPKVPEGFELAIHGTHFRTTDPLFCIGYESYSCFESFVQRKTAPESQLLAESACVLDAMISTDLLNRAWRVERAGPTHCLWRVLRRLSRLALEKLDVPESRPEIDLREYISVGRWVPKRIAATRTCNDAFNSLALAETGFSPPIIDGSTLEVEAFDVGLLPDHPWYVKPVLASQKLKRCRLVFHGVSGSRRVISVVEDQWRSQTRADHLVVDVNKESRNLNDSADQVFEFTGTMINWEPDSTDQKGMTGYVKWTIKANAFELIDENWTNESDAEKKS